MLTIPEAKIEGLLEASEIEDPIRHLDKSGFERRNKKTPEYRWIHISYLYHELSKRELSTKNRSFLLMRI